MPGYIRLANIRGDRDYGPEGDEVAITVDRTHPSLGNKNYLKDKSNSAERDKVLYKHVLDLDLDELKNGPATAAIRELAQRVIAGEKIVLLCWCAPLRCHGDELIRRVMLIVDRSK